MSNMEGSVDTTESPQRWRRGLKGGREGERGVERVGRTNISELIVEGE